MEMPSLEAVIQPGTDLSDDACLTLSIDEYG